MDPRGIPTSIEAAYLTVTISDEIRANLKWLETLIFPLNFKLGKGKGSIYIRVSEVADMIAKFNEISVGAQLQSQKGLSNSEREKLELAFEEYKLALIEASCLELSKSVPTAFAIEESLKTKLKELQLKKKLKLNPNFIKCDIAYPTVDELFLECQQLESYIINGDLSDAEKETVEEYFHLILDTPLFKNSGRGHSFRQAEMHRTLVTNNLKRFSFLLPKIMEILSNASLSIFELLGTNSFITLIPGISNPTTLIVAGVLTFAAAVAEFSFGLKLFKDNYGFSFFGQPSRTKPYVFASEIRGTRNLDAMLKDAAVTHRLHSDTFLGYANLALALNSNVQQKTGKKGEFSFYDESKWRKAIRWCVLGLNLLMTVSSWYFASAALLSLGVIPLLTVGAAITPLGWIFIALSVAAGIYCFYLNQANSIYALINPECEQYESLKTDGKKVTDKTLSKGLTYTHVYAQKQFNEAVVSRATTEATPQYVGEPHDVALNPSSVLPYATSLRSLGSLWKIPATDTSRSTLTQGQTQARPLSDYQSDPTTHRDPERSSPSL